MEFNRDLHRFCIQSELEVAFIVRSQWYFPVMRQWSFTESSYFAARKIRRRTNMFPG